MTENEDVSLSDEERNIMLLLLLTIKAYEIENDELFSVDSELANDMISEYVEAGTSVPELHVTNDGQRMIMSVEMREPGAEDVEYKMNIGEEEENE